MVKEIICSNTFNFYIIIIIIIEIKCEQSCVKDDDKCDTEKHYNLCRTAGLESFEANIIQSKIHGTRKYDLLILVSIPVIKI
jgi:hypothetical protein